MRISEKINRTGHRLFVRYVMARYRLKIGRVQKKHPELFRAVDSGLSARHCALWGRLGPLAGGDRWLRLHVNLTGLQDYRFCPEDVFFARIERVLNDCNRSGAGPEDKNNLWRYVPEGAEPDTILRYVRGAYCDARGKWMSPEAAGDVISRESGDLVGKIACSSGGGGVRLFRKSGGAFTDGEDVLTPGWIARQSDSYLVQRKIRQDRFSASFNPSSVNTVRMMTMRCPWDGKVVVLRSMMRIGVSDAIVDNMMRGGLCVCIGDKGRLGRCAYDYDGKRYGKHPVSGKAFEGLIHPGYEAMAVLAGRIAGQIPDYNLLSFDFVPREDGTICLVEINATSQGITQLQYDFGGLFGEYSERVVDWCAAHAELDRFDHLRTFY